MPRILLSDDEPYVRRCFEIALDADDIEIEGVIGGTDALELMADKSYDLLFTDILNPQMDGYDLIAKVSELHPEIPIIITSTPLPGDLKYTALVEHGLAITLKKQGVRGFLEKPFDRATLFEAISHGLRAEKMTSVKVWPYGMAQWYG